MVELSRRFFLKGSIALVAAVTFVPSVSALANIPTIYGDGKHDDTGGLQALMRNEPVNFNADQIGVESHHGIIFYKGFFSVERTINVPPEVDVKFLNYTTFIGTKLEELPFFRCMGKNGYNFMDNRNLAFELPNGKHMRGSLVTVFDSQIDNAYAKANYI